MSGHGGHLAAWRTCPRFPRQIEGLELLALQSYALSLPPAQNLWGTPSPSVRMQEAVDGHTPTTPARSDLPAAAAAPVICLRAPHLQEAHSLLMGCRRPGVRDVRYPSVRPDIVGSTYAAPARVKSSGPWSITRRLSRAGDVCPRMYPDSTARCMPPASVI